MRPGNVALEEKGKVLLENFVRRLLPAGKFELIAEEAGFGCPYLGRKLADEIGCDYVNIAMTEFEKQQACILTSDDVYSLRCTTAEWEKDQLRKDPFMFNSLMAAARGKRKVLVICGPLHVEGLRERLRESGAQVADFDIRSHPAYELGMDAENPRPGK